MFTAKEYVMPQTLDEAYKLLMARKNNYILGGCAWLRMGKRRINTAVDLSEAGLDFINETKDSIEIGAMTSYHSVETSALLKAHFDGMLCDCVANIIGTQFRNTVTVGGSIFARFGFSDFLTPLLVLDTYVVLYKEGIVSLSDFMQQPYKKDILIKIMIKKDGRRLNYQMFRNSHADFPIVNVAVSRLEDEYKVSVGARPSKAVVANQTSIFLSNTHSDNLELASIEAGEIMANEIGFSTNTKASANYRETIAKVLLKRAVTEVSAC